MTVYIIPIIFLLILVFAFVKKVNVYKSFTRGAADAIKLCFEIAPFICVILIGIQLLSQSGLLAVLVDYSAPVFEFLGIPRQVVHFVILKPFSGGGSIAVFEEIVKAYGAESYITRVASVIAGSSETVFYISAVYFSKTNIKKLGYAIPVALFCTFLSAIFAALICKIT